MQGTELVKAPGETLIGQAESFLYRDSIPEITVDFHYEGRSLLIPEPVGYDITFRCKNSKRCARALRGRKCRLR